MVTPAEAKMNRLARRKRRRAQRQKGGSITTHYVPRQVKAQRQRRLGGRFSGGYRQEELDVDVVTCDGAVPCYPVIPPVFDEETSI